MGLKDYVKEVKGRPEFRFAFPVAEVARNAGAALRRLREASGKKQGDIAKELGLSQPRMSQIESGTVEHLPSLALMAKYAEVCDDAICVLPKSEYDALLAAAAEGRVPPTVKEAVDKLSADTARLEAVRNQAKLEG